jgi:hypothetical protein
LFTAFFLIFFITVIALFVNFFFPIEQRLIGQSIFITVLIGIEYFICILLNYSLRRRFRHFCSQVVTISLNQFLIEKSSCQNLNLLKK